MTEDDVRNGKDSDGKSPPSADLDGDGMISEKEFKFLERRLNTTRKLAIGSFASLVAAAAYILGLMPPERMETLNGSTDIIFIVLGGVVATYMGAEAFITKRQNKSEY